MKKQSYEQKLIFGKDAQASLKRKALSRLMLDAGIDKPQIAQVIGVSERQVYNYEKQIPESGKPAACCDTRYRPQSEMEDYEDLILKELVERPVATAKEAAGRIQQLTGLKRSPAQVRTFWTEALENCPDTRKS